ncbi:hypothetical protein VPH35_097343 [Triticum aestivum]
MRSQVDLMIEGVPSHAWTTEIAAELLGSACLIESLAPETKNKEDLSLFKLRAWCVDPEEVPVDKRLWVPEPETNYKTFIHIGRIRDHEGPERWLRLPSSDGSGQSGTLEDFGDYFGQGEWHVLQWTRGALVGRIGPSDWRIPPMASCTAVTACALSGSTMGTATNQNQDDVAAAARAPPALQLQLATEYPGRSSGVRPAHAEVVANPAQLSVLGRIRSLLTR